MDEEYQRLNERDHLLLRPANTLGDVVLESRTEAVYDFPTGRMLPKQFMISVGLEQTFREMITNVADALEKGVQRGYPVGFIDLQLTPTTVTLMNYGLPIFVKRDASGAWWPEILFSEFRSSSNYNDAVKRTVAGMNGLGGKAVTVFSKRFSVRVVDAVNQLVFTQTYYDNLGSRTEPVVVPLVPGDDGMFEPSSVVVSYDLDFPRFGITEYSPEHLGLFARYAIEVAMDAQVPLRLNGLDLPVVNIETLARMFYPENALYTFIDTVNRVQICYVDAPNSAMTLSYVNGVRTPNDGVHVKAAYDQAFKLIIPSNFLSKRGAAGSSKAGGKGKGKAGKDNGKDSDKAAKGPKIEEVLAPEDLEKHLAVFMTCRLDKPKFTTQAKVKLKAPGPEFTVPAAFATIGQKWSLVRHLQAIVDSKKFLLLKSTDGKKERFVSLDGPGIRDANWAGTARSAECFLVLCEGQSAAKYVNKMRSFMPSGADIIGICPLRGKPINVMKATTQELVDNKELKNIKKMLGVRENVDYTIPANKNTLRYSKLLIGCDSDDDGQHIKGLVVVMMNMYPSLLMIPFLYSWETPVIRVPQPGGGDPIKFYRASQFAAWELDNPNHAKPKFLKGLSSSNDANIREDIRVFRAILHYMDAHGDAMLRMVFDDKLADARKKWITEWRPSLNPVPTEHQSITELVNDDLIVFALTSLRRALPSICDGFKRVQRQVLYGARKVAPFTVKEPMIVARLAARIAEEAGYHHGPISIEETLLRMGFDHVGTNNLPYFFRDGQFGDRQSAEPVAARYPSAKLAWWVNLIFQKLDEPILGEHIEDGVRVEPHHYNPIIPMVLVNGCRSGVAMGWSTMIPAHHPLAVVDWLLAVLQGQQPKPLVPWYRGFTQQLEVRDKHYISRGSFEIQAGARAGTKNIVITELPLFRLYDTYKTFLDGLVNQEIITGYTDSCTDEKPYFVLENVKMPEPTLQTLKLQRVHSTVNMTVLDERGIPIKYTSTEEIMWHYFRIRLDAYERRRAYEVGKLTDDLVMLKLKLDYLQRVVSKEIILIDADQELLHEEFERRNYPRSFLKLSHDMLTRQGIVTVSKAIETANVALAVAEATTATSTWITELTAFRAGYVTHYPHD